MSTYSLNRPINKAINKAVHGPIGAYASAGASAFANAETSAYVLAVTEEGGTVSPDISAAIDETFTEWKTEPSGDPSVLSRLDHVWVPASDDANGANVALINNYGSIKLVKSGGGSPVYSKAGGYKFDGAHGLTIPGFTETAVVSDATRSPVGQYWTISNYLMVKAQVSGSYYIFANNIQNDLRMADSGGTNYQFYWSQGNNSSRAYPTLPALLEVGNSRNFAINNLAHFRENGVVVFTQGRTSSFNVAVSTTEYMWGGKNAGTTEYDIFTTGAMGMGQEWYQSSDATLNAQYQRQAVLYNTGIQRIMTALGR